VLLGTATFWEGVDVAGDALSLVVIDKLPFESPGDPVLQARLERCRERGGNPFMELQVPAAALALAQGFGRLVRTRTDRGIVAVLDARLTARPYGRRILAGLPQAPVVSEFDVLARWWRAAPGPTPDAAGGPDTAGGPDGA
jgi:ATP-dependent DNA helicase DinG